VIGERIYRGMWGEALSDFILKTKTRTFVLVRRPREHIGSEGDEKEKNHKREFILEWESIRYTGAEITLLLENIRKRKLDNIILQYFYREDERNNEGVFELNFKEEVEPFIREFKRQGITVSGIFQTGSRFNSMSFCHVKWQQTKNNN
jgi:hypothetical protein